MIPDTDDTDDTEGASTARDAELESLDGHTIDQLSDYLDRGRLPADRSIDESPGCQLALADLERLRAVALERLDGEALGESARDDSWVRRILGGIGMDARAGRDIPLAHRPDEEIVVTEGAVRGIVRAAGDEVGGLIVGRVRLDGDVTVPGAPVTVAVEVSVMWGERIPALVDAVRRAIREAVERHTDLEVTAVDVAVHDVLVTVVGGRRTDASGPGAAT